MADLPKKLKPLKDLGASFEGLKDMAGAFEKFKGSLDELKPAIQSMSEELRPAIENLSEEMAGKVNDILMKLLKVNVIGSKIDSDDIESHQKKVDFDKILDQLMK